MPIEIRELVIKTSVNNSDTRSTGSDGQEGNSEAMINEVVDRVCKIIQQKSER
ncbi:MAG TPA: DUF5908 family protein [Aequorivita sp.]|nr:DUF5908 family protein [Aequorivita sp.]